MTLPVFDPPMSPSAGLQVKPQIKLLEAEFGDGYSQIARHGINHIRDVMELRWEVLTVQEAKQIEGFLRDRGGDQPFTYAVPDISNANQWRCAEWQQTALGGSLFSIDATFKQDFSLNA